jgi:hypothetical protein
MRRMKRDGGITLIGWILMIAVALTLMALAVPAYVRAGRHDALVGCRGHLKSMFEASMSPTLAKEPPALGSAYWTRLAAAQPPLVSPETPRCPMVPPEIRRPTDYLGPVKDPATLDGAEPIGCDMEENHGEHGKMGGTVLYKSGEIRTLHPRETGAPQDPWREALRNKCAP